MQDSLLLAIGGILRKRPPIEEINKLYIEQRLFRYSRICQYLHLKLCLMCHIDNNFQIVTELSLVLKLEMPKRITIDFLLVVLLYRFVEPIYTKPAIFFFFC